MGAVEEFSRRDPLSVDGFEWGDSQRSAGPSQVILPELWDAAVDMFDASRTGVVSDRKRTQKVQEKVGTAICGRWRV